MRHSPAAREATYNHNALLCPDCRTAKFIRPSALAKHRANKCGMVAKRLERRRDHDACTIRARVKHMDGDLAEEAEIAESVGLDLRTVHFPSAPYDWVLVEQLSTAHGNVAPLAFAGLAWTQAGSLGLLTDGVRVCISAARLRMRRRMTLLRTGGRHGITVGCEAPPTHATRQST